MTILSARSRVESNLGAKFVFGQFLYGLVIGEGENKFASFSVLAFDPDSSAVRLNDAAADAETQSGSLFFQAGRAAGPVKFFEHPLFVFGRNPHAGVADANLSEACDEDIALH